VSTLSTADTEKFERDGYLVVRQAFDPADAAAMERRWWAEITEAHGLRRDDPAGWRPIRGDLKAAKRDPEQRRILTARVRGVLDDLLGPGRWQPPRNWGRALATFPGAGTWDVPKRLWHWDNPVGAHLDRPGGLFVVSFVGRVEPRGGGTLILSGSPRLLLRQERDLGPDRYPGCGTPIWERFHRSHPWLAALTGHAPSPADRLAAFTTTETDVHGVPLRVVELTGAPGDLVVCHPLIVHCAAPNNSPHPRLTRIKTLLPAR
jgi:hypothetical protein